MPSCFRFLTELLSLCVAVLGWFFFPSCLLAAEPVPVISKPTETVSGAINDCRLTILARQALAQDELLAPLNLGVSVRTHVAVLWGPVPSAALAQRAVAQVRQVQGLAGVVNQLVVETPGDPLLEFLKTPRPKTGRRLEAGDRGLEMVRMPVTTSCSQAAGFQSSAYSCPALSRHPAKKESPAEVSRGDLPILMPPIPLPVRANGN